MKTETSLAFGKKPCGKIAREQLEMADFERLGLDNEKRFRFEKLSEPLNISETQTR